MFNPKDQRITEIVELLEQINLISADEIEIIEDYLTEAADEQVLEKLTFRDLSVVPGDLSAKVSMLLRKLLNRGRNEEAGKLGKVLFILGQSTSYGMFPANLLPNEKYNAFAIYLEPAERAAIYAAVIGANEYQIGQYSFKNLMKLAENKPENLKKAMDYQKMQNSNGKLILLAAYFLLKFPEDHLWQQSQPEEQDAALMKQYEKILVYSIPKLYNGRLPRLEADELGNAVANDCMNARILGLAKVTADRFMLRILGGSGFLNYTLSAPLKNMVMVCFAANTEQMLDIISDLDLRNDLRRKGGNYDEIFGMDSKKYIRWAAQKNRKNILKSQFERNQKAYLECMDSADFETYNKMAALVKELKPDLYEGRREKEINRQQSKVIENFVKMVDAKAAGAVKKYLSGESEIDMLYAIEDILPLKGYYWGGRYWNILQKYQENYGFDALSSRCEVLMMMCRILGYQYILKSGDIDAKEIRRLFAAADSEKLSLKHQLNGFADISDSFYQEKMRKAFTGTAQEIFGSYLKDRRDEMISAFQSADSVGRSFGLLVLSGEPEMNKEAILSFSQDTAKTVKETLLELLYEQRGWEEDILKLLSSKKAADREIAIRVLSKWDAGKYAPQLAAALEKEKNAKVRALLETALNVSAEESSGGNAITQEDLVKELHKGNKKRSLAWAYETPFSAVHKKNGEEAPEEYLQAVFLAYSSMGTCGVSQSAKELAGALDDKEFAVYVNELFDKWLEAGAESKKRWVLYAAAVHGGADIIKKLQHQIQEWPQAARGAIASEAVQALALNPQPQALLIVDGISRKFKFKQVKAAAGKALEFAAAQLGITKEELADRIVPDLGFDENMERIFDYGERKFTVTITPTLEIEVFDENKKKLKNLPAPGKKDDEARAAAAYEEFKQMKKQMKAAVSSQKLRLEMALSTGREWSVSAWKALFVKNPLMHQFAIGLIWGIYENRKLTAAFRYMEDGSFNTEDEDEFELPEEGKIALVHPIELSEQSKKAWKEQLEDYEIVQPVEQLIRPVYYRTKEEEEQKSLERFGGCIVNDLSLGGKLQALGWYRGSVQDAGGFYTYYREDPELFLGVELHFSGSFVGGENEDVTVYEVRFYNAGGVVLSENGGVMIAGIKRGSYVYDEANDSNSYMLKEVPERYFSEIVLQLTKALASSKERNENWKAQR